MPCAEGVLTEHGDQVAFGQRAFELDALALAVAAVALAHFVELIDEALLAVLHFGVVLDAGGTGVACDGLGRL